MDQVEREYCIKIIPQVIEVFERHANNFKTVMTATLLALPGTMSEKLRKAEKISDDYERLVNCFKLRMDLRIKYPCTLDEILSELSDYSVTLENMTDRLEDKYGFKRSYNSLK